MSSERDWQAVERMTARCEKVEASCTQAREAEAEKHSKKLSEPFEASFTAPWMMTILQPDKAKFAASTAQRANVAPEMDLTTT